MGSEQPGGRADGWAGKTYLLVFLTWALVLAYGWMSSERERRAEKKLDAIMDHLGISEAAPDER